MQIHTDIIQGSDEWHRMRLGKITGSCFNKLLGTKDAKEKHLYKIANEIVTGCRCDGDDYTNIHMQRGNDFENVARMKYITTTFSEVQEVGLVSLNEYVSCSPDGLVGDDGMIEIKVPDSNNYFQSICEISSKGNLAITNEHAMQMQFNMYVCGRSWCDYVLYNQKHEVNNKELYIHRIRRGGAMQELISSVLEECIAKIKSYVERYNIIANRSGVYD